MQTKASNPADGLPDGVPAVLAAYHRFNQLKHLYRQGWLQRGVPPERCESVAEHSLGVAVLAWWLAAAYDPELDADKVIRMALIHDFGEVYAGDLTPQDGVMAEEKSQQEWEGAQRVFAGLPGEEKYLALWREYEDGASPEARFVKQIDRLEMAFQAGIYERQGLGPLPDFFLSAREALTSPELRDLLDEAVQLRPGGR